MREQIVGRVFPGIKVVAKAGKDRSRHILVTVKCLRCGKVSPTPMRWSDLTRAPKGSRPSNKSCGCLEDAAFQAHIDKNISEIPQSERFAIWAAAQVATSTLDVAKRFGLDKYALTALITQTRALIKDAEAFAVQHDLDWWLFSQRWEKFLLLDGHHKYSATRFLRSELATKAGVAVGSLSRQCEAASELLCRFKDLDQNDLTIKQAFTITGSCLLESLKVARRIEDMRTHTVVLRRAQGKQHALEAKLEKATKAARAAKRLAAGLGAEPTRARPTRLKATSATYSLDLDGEDADEFVCNFNHSRAAIVNGAV
jgi:hypothetical protein